MVNSKTRRRFNTLKGSHMVGEGWIFLKPSVPLSLMMTNQMSLIWAGIISLDRSFKFHDRNFFLNFRVDVNPLSTLILGGYITIPACWQCMWTSRRWAGGWPTQARRWSSGWRRVSWPSTSPAGPLHTSISLRWGGGGVELLQVSFYSARLLILMSFLSEIEVSLQ